MKPSAPASRSEVEDVLRCRGTRSAPLFLPAIYEHKAWFVGSTPSAISRNAGLLARAMLAEFSTIGPDALTVGVDVYNIEAEAVGCRVNFHEGSDVPTIIPESRVIRVGDDLSRARLPHPLRDGRMPVNIEAARRVREAVGDACWLRGSLSGPFSLAACLVGAEELFMACVDSPDWVRRLLAYAGSIVREYAKAYLDVGAELVVFDSQASPELLSPSMYADLVLPATAEFIGWAKACGAGDVPLVIGGDTTPIAGMLCQTGANNLLCDYTGDFQKWSAVCREAKRALRRNLPPHLLVSSTPDSIYEAARRNVALGSDLPGFIMGTAVIPFGTPTGNILAVKEACRAQG